MKHQKRVMAVHDLSCFGKCSLTTAIPIISAAGVETVALPTAVLSTHTGGFTGYTFRDLTEDIPAITRHWKSLSLHFDAIYTGYLGSFEQLEIVSKVIDSFRCKDTLIYTDPVMADSGRLYPSFRPDFPEGMAKLCKKADIILPNLTEAAFLVGEPYREGPYSKEYIEGLLKRLAALGPKKIVLTGVWDEPEHLGCAVYDAESNCVGYAMSRRIEGSYHGTGDVFASALLGALMNGMPLLQSAQKAVDFTVGSIRRTRTAGTDVRFGVNFEAGLPEYLRSLGLTK
ncbi:MAG TPA: pyridoxamine kinase [Ruminococcaceae bacterium]|jgi:pyridoxine kinase|nr:pyridoxamine kinase [Oscillospiraceae bacterium]